MDSFQPVYIPTRPYTPDLSQVGQKQKASTAKESQDATVSFDQFLSDSVSKQDRLKFSAHAQDRARMRNITFSEGQLARLGAGVDKASAKGANEALVMVDNLAAVVSVGNKTVITVADTQQMRDNVFTNIDSAVIV